MRVSRHNRLLHKVFLTFTILYLMACLCSYAQAATAVATWDAVTLSVTGQPVTGVTYNLYRSVNLDMSAKTKLNSVTISTTTYSDTTAPSGSNVYYQVNAVASDGTEGAGSNIVRYNTNDKIPAAPSNLRFPQFLNMEGFISKSNMKKLLLIVCVSIWLGFMPSLFFASTKTCIWDPVTKYTDQTSIPMGTVVTYKIYRATKPDLTDATQIGISSTTSFTDNLVPRKVRVYYFVTASVSSVNGPNSNVINWYTNRR